MTTTLTPVLDAVTVPADEPAAAPVQASDPTAGCAVLTLAVLTVAVTDPKHPMWAAAALALTAVTVGWAGRSAFGTAWTALRGGGLAAESLTAAGLLAMLVVPVATALHGPIDLIPAAAAAAAATLHCAGEAIAVRIERTPGVRDMVDTQANGLADALGRPMTPAGPVELAHRGAVALERAADRATGGVVALVVVLAVAALAFRLGNGASTASALGVAGAVLLVACPRSVGRAAAAALVAGTARATRLGADVDGPRTVDELARVDTVVLCRTGTVTIGVRALGRVYVTDGVDPDEALHIAGAVTAAGRDAGGTAGRHAVGAVVADAAQERFGELPGVAEFDGYPGLGVRGIVSELRAAPASSPVSSTGTRPSLRRPRMASAAPGRTGSTTSRTARATPSQDTATAVAPADWIVVTASASPAGRSIPCPVTRATRPTSAAWAITRGSSSGSARNSEMIPRTPSPG